MTSAKNTQVIISFCGLLIASRALCQTHISNMYNLRFPLRFVKAHKSMRYRPMRTSLNGADRRWFTLTYFLSVIPRTFHLKKIRSTWCLLLWSWQHFTFKRTKFCYCRTVDWFIVLDSHVKRKIIYIGKNIFFSFNLESR